jgi:ribosomal protein S27E
MAEKAVVVKLKKQLLYIPPFKEDGSPCWCPIVVKDVDSLINWMNGFHYMKNVAETAFGVKFKELDVPLSSNRFDDILPDGRRFNEMTKAEQENFNKEKTERRAQVLNDPKHQIDVNIFEESFLQIDCPCCSVPYVFKDANELPGNNFNCSTCGYLLIQYTGHDDEEYIFNG